MYTPVEFVVELVTDVGRLIGIFNEQLIGQVGDPLALVVFAVGQALMLGAVLAFAYGVVGAAAKEIGVDLPALGNKGPAEK